MATISREIQRKALLELQEHYPTWLDVQNPDWLEMTPKAKAANLAYLEEHDLIALKWREGIGFPKSPFLAMITAKGIDFLADDGGLSAILGVVTVKLHEDTIRELLIKRVENSDAPPTVKSQLIGKIRELPSTALSKVAERGLEEGLERVPDLVEWLRTLTGL